MQEFEVTEDHIKLLQNFYISYNDYCEFGAPEICPKRPYGNSDVFGDIGEALGIKPEDEEEGYFSDEQEAEMHRLHLETQYALQILVDNLSIEPGIYVKENKWSNKGWQKR